VRFCTIRAMNYAFLQSLLTQAEAFEREKPAAEQQTLADFGAWLGQQFPQIAAQTDTESEQTDALGIEIGSFVSYLYRYAKLYSKKALADTPLSTIDEFSYLVMLIEGPAPTKTELIDRNIHEKTTGIEILRRLINGGLIEQFDDPTDRRSQRLMLTERGRRLMFQILPRMTYVAKLIEGNLTIAEKKQLVFLLNKLHLFHNQLFKNERDTSVEILVSQLEDLKK
jgi:MarR family transcriptional regulator, lower aerobic nicotinate degradation pathway regulator